MTSILPKKYLAASVPRFLRVNRLSYLSKQSIIGTRAITGENGANLIFDIVMLPDRAFHVMRLNIGLQHISESALQAGAAYDPVFVPEDTKEIIVPDEEPDPESFARNYFQIEFGFITPPPAPFADVARECAVRLSALSHAAELTEAAIDWAEDGEDDPRQKAANKQR